MLLATTTIAVASVSGAAGWELNSHIKGASTTADDQWLIKLVDLAGQFPSGFHLTSADANDVTEQSLRRPETLTRGATVIPAHCANPAEQAVGASPPAGAIVGRLTGIASDRLLEVTALVSSQPIPLRVSPPHCDAVVFYRAGLIQGFTGPISLPPTPEGVAVKSSQAVRARYTITDGNGPSIDTVRYVYRVLLDDLHSVTVTFIGRISPGRIGDIDTTPADELFSHALATLRSP